MLFNYKRGNYINKASFLAFAFNFFMSKVILYIKLLSLFLVLCVDFALCVPLLSENSSLPNPHMEDPRVYILVLTLPQILSFVSDSTMAEEGLYIYIYIYMLVSSLCVAIFIGDIYGFANRRPQVNSLEASASLSSGRRCSQQWCALHPDAVLSSASQGVKVV